MRLGGDAMRLGQRRFEAINALIEERLREQGTLIAVHRGTAIASIVENTVDAARAAIASGGDIVEIDAAATVDGRFFAFHDGAEPRLLGVTENIRRMTAAQVESLRYLHADRPGRPARVEPLLEVLDAVRGGPLLNVDRSWWWWPALLHELDRLDMTPQLLLKARAWEPGPIRALQEHPVKYPFMPICRTLAEAERHLGDPRLNTVGVELLAADTESPFLDGAVIAGLRARGVFTFVNAEVLNSGDDLFAGYDDERSVLDSAEAGWGPLFDLGIDVIQTDWPWLLRDLRERRRATAAAAAAGATAAERRTA